VKNFFTQVFTRRSSSAPIALLTDFGTTDPYVGAMKGVIASIRPDATVIDICHTTGPQNVLEASYFLWSCYRFFPRDTLFIVVVDPGVGTDRNILLLRMASRWFLAPDNGVLDFVMGDEAVESTTSIRMTNSPYVLSTVSKTFQGRDVFAPVGAYISLGVLPEELGKKIKAPRIQSTFVTAKSERFGSVLHVDHFGNVISNIRPTDGNRPASVSIGGKVVRRWIKNYQEAPAKIPCVIIGSSGLVELVVKNDHAGRRLHARSGARLGVLWP